MNRGIKQALYKLETSPRLGRWDREINVGLVRSAIEEYDAIEKQLRCENYALRHVLEWAESIENDDGSIPAPVWKKLQTAIKQAKEAL